VKPERRTRVRIRTSWLDGISVGWSDWRPE
jgi:hypothetical protein